MFAASAAFQDAYKSGAEQDILLVFADGSTIGKSDISITSGGLTLSEYMNSDTDYTIGKAPMAEMKIMLMNKGGKFDAFNFSQYFDFRFGVSIDGVMTYIPLGRWVGERPEKVRTNLIEFTAYDVMKYFDRSAETFLNESITLPAVLAKVFSQAFDSISPPVTYGYTFPANKAMQITHNRLDSNQITFREYFAKIAEAAGGYMKPFGGADTDTGTILKPYTFTQTSYVVERKGRFELSVSDFPSPQVDRLEVYTSYSDKLIASGTGSNVYVISDNPFLYAENDDDVAALQANVDALYDVLAAFPEYYPASLRAVGAPWLECGDIITVMDDNDTPLVFPIFAKTMTWTGAWMMTLENTGGVTRQNKSVEQRQLETLKKKMLRATDLQTAIESYINTDEGKASIVSAVSGAFVTADALDAYATTTEVSTAITQAVNSLAAEISLEAEYGSGTLGSNVRALLSLVANPDSSEIKLKADYVTIESLKTEGATVINGANIMTGTISADALLVKNVYFKDPDSSGNNISIITSEMITNNNALINFGIQSYVNNNQDTLQQVNMMGTDFFFFPPSSDYNNSLRIDTRNRRLMPQTAGDWTLGIDDCPFGVMFTHELYVIDTDNPLDNYVYLWYSEGILYATLHYGNNSTTIELASF